MAKFVVYEKVAEAVYKRVDKSQTSDRMQTVINLGSGLIAGFAAAIVSQPADTMLSKINKTKGLPGEGTTSRLIKIAKELGLRGSYTGIGARLFMVCLDFLWVMRYKEDADICVPGGNSYRRTVCYLWRHQESSRLVIVICVWKYLLTKTRGHRWG